MAYYDENGNWVDDTDLGTPQPDPGIGEGGGFAPDPLTFLFANPTQGAEGGGYPSFQTTENVTAPDPGNPGDPSTYWEGPIEPPYTYGEPPEKGFLGKLADGAKEVGKNLTAGIGSPAGTAAGLTALGAALSSLFSKPLFQERTGYTGAAAPQHVQEEVLGNINQFLPLLMQRAAGPHGADIPSEDTVRARLRRSE